MIRISNNVSLADEEVEFSAIRAQGSGGQNVNKVSSAIHLRFNIMQSSLPDFYKQRLMASNDKRITKDGILIIKAQTFRTQEKNKQDAIARFQELVQSVSVIRKNRKETRPTRSSQQKRMDKKTQRGKVKALRGKVF